MSSSSDSPQIALVTGAAKRLGRAIALALADHGWDIALHYHHSTAAAEQTAAEIRARGRRVVLVQADLGKEAEVERIVPRIGAELGPLRCLVNNASVFEMDKVETATRDSWDRHIETNLRAPLVLSQAFARQLPDAAEGNIINLLDQRVLKPDPRFVSYALSRNGLWWATRTLAQALAPRIRVNGVGPGPTLPSTHQTQADFDAEARNTLLARPGSPQAVAEAVRWLVDAELVTGQMIAVDGGQHLAWKTPDIVE